MTIFEQIKQVKIVPVVVLKELSDTEPTLQALCDGGLPVAEITFRIMFPHSKLPYEKK